MTDQKRRFFHSKPQFLVVTIANSLIYIAHLVFTCTPVIKGDTFRFAEERIDEHTSFLVKWLADFEATLTQNRIQLKPEIDTKDNMGLPNLPAWGLEYMEDELPILPISTDLSKDFKVLDYGVPGLFRLQKLARCKVIRREHIEDKHLTSEHLNIQCQTLMAIIEVVIRSLSCFGATMWCSIALMLFTMSPEKSRASREVSLKNDPIRSAVTYSRTR